MTIKLLSQNIINQIAAGEVIERPASVIKELMENAIDACATEIVVHIIDAGKSFISVSDNGIGMDKDSLELCVLSHATSKLASDNLFDIHTFGFRGEALPSISSVSRMTIASAKQHSVGWSLQMEGVTSQKISPISRNIGTTVEIRDLFFATPARLKFLKSDAAELENCNTVFNRIALAFCGISFKFIDTNKEKLSYTKTNDLETRIEDIFGTTFTKNMFKINCEQETLKLYGYIGVPTFNKASTGYQYFFVNNRFVKDKIFMSALKSAYAGLIPTGRYAVAIIFLEIPFNMVDVNAHPAKIEVRFRDAERVRLFIVSALKKALFSFGSKSTTTELIDNFYAKKNMENNTIPVTPSYENKRSSEYNPLLSSPVFSASKNLEFSNGNSELSSINNYRESRINTDTASEASQFSLNLAQTTNNNTPSMGHALHQINCTYIVATTDDSLIVVDQHAAAERIMLEELKKNLKLRAQNLLIPEIYTLSEANISLLKINDELLRKLGVYIDYLSKDLISINALPAMLETSNAKSIVTDIIDELSMFGDLYSIDEKIHSILSSMSCHGSIRAGKQMSIEEMNHLLRQMEISENIAQCCHGRPTYIKISIKDLDKFFERS